MAIIAILLCAILSTVSLVHVYWGFGGKWPGGNSVELARTVVGEDRMPSSAACFAAAIAIAITAVWPLFLARVFMMPWPGWVTLLGGGFIAAVFLARGAAGYHPAWRKRLKEEPFARYDRLFYSPLCLFLGACYCILLLPGLHF